MSDWASVFVGIAMLSTTIVGGVAVWVWRISGQIVPRPELDRRFSSLKREIHDDMRAMESRNTQRLADSEVRADKRFDKLEERLTSIDAKLDRLIERRVE